jgi:hypothetical protein
VFAVRHNSIQLQIDYRIVATEFIVNAYDCQDRPRDRRAPVIAFHERKAYSLRRRSAIRNSAHFSGGKSSLSERRPDIPKELTEDLWGRERLA